MNSQKITENIVQLPSELVAQQEQLDIFCLYVAGLMGGLYTIISAINIYYYAYYRVYEAPFFAALPLGMWMHHIFFVYWGFFDKEFLFDFLGGSEGATAYNCFIRFIILLLIYWTFLFMRYSIKTIQQKISLYGDLALQLIEHADRVIKLGDKAIKHAAEVLDTAKVVIEELNREKELNKQKEEQLKELKDQRSKEKEEKEEQPKNPAQKEKEDIKIKENTWVPKAFIKQIFVAARNSARNLKQRRFFYNGTMRP